MSAVRWTETAAGDLASIRDYIAHDSPTIAQLVARLYETVSILADTRMAGGPFQNATIRPCGNWSGIPTASSTSVGATRSSS